MRKIVLKKFLLQRASNKKITLNSFHSDVFELLILLEHHAVSTGIVTDVSKDRKASIFTVNQSEKGCKPSNLGTLDSKNESAAVLPNVGNY
jgi:nitrate reductase gamma subunit